MSTARKEFASEYVESLADEMTQPHRKLAGASFSLSLAARLSDLLDAKLALGAAIARLPLLDDIAFELSEPDAALLQRILRLCLDEPVAPLQAASTNLELRKTKQFEAAQNAYRQRKFSHDEEARERAAERLHEIKLKAVKRAQKWIHASIDKWVFGPRPRF